jgi:hypothetical protein
MAMTSCDSQSKIWRGHRATHGPDWRCQLARTLPAHSSRLAAIEEDPAVRELQRYFAHILRDGPQEAAAAFPIIVQAADLEQDASRRQTLMLMAMAGLEFEEMQKRLEIPVPVIQAWEANYFDVRDCREALVWIESKIIRKEREAGNTELAARLHLAAMAGPEGARALLDCDNAPVDEAERLFQRQLKLVLKLDEALNKPVNTERESFRFVQFHGTLVIARQQLELARARLTEKCTASRERHERKKLQLEFAVQREAARAAKLKRATGDRRAAKAAGAAGETRQDLARYRRRAEQMACQARALLSPLAQLRWMAGADRHSPPKSKKRIDRRPIGARRPKSRPTGRTIPPEIRRDHRSASDHRAQTGCGIDEAAVVHNELTLTG